MFCRRRPLASTSTLTTSVATSSTWPWRSTLGAAHPPQRPVSVFRLMLPACAVGVSVPPRRLNLKGRVVLCGGISQYNATKPKGPSNYFALVVKRARMEGFLVFDYQDRYPQGAQRPRPTHCCAPSNRRDVNRPRTRMAPRPHSDGRPASVGQRGQAGTPRCVGAHDAWRCCEDANEPRAMHALFASRIRRAETVVEGLEVTRSLPLPRAWTAGGTQIDRQARWRAQ